VAVALFALVGCADRGHQTGKISIDAAFYPLAFVAQWIGGSAVTVHNLTPPGGEPHDLELRPSDAVAIKGADLVLYIRGFQPAVDDAIRPIDLARTMDARSVVPLLHLGNGSVDPHFWLDPTRLISVARAVEQRLERSSPASTALFQQNLKTFIEALTRLDTEFRSGLSSCARHEIFTGHTAFGYLANRYGLRQIGITGLDPEAEPSPQQLSKIINLARALHPTVIFAETLVSSRSVDTVARNVGARVETLNPLEGLTRDQDRSRADYLSVMRGDLQVLQEGLGCRAA